MGFYRKPVQARIQNAADTRERYVARASAYEGPILGGDLVSNVLSGVSWLSPCVMAE